MAQLSPDKQGAKKATRALVAAVGGQEPAAAFCTRRIRQQQFSDFGSPNVETFLSIDAVIDLEGVTKGSPGWPQVTRYLAARQNCAVVILPDAATPDTDWWSALERMIKENSDVSTGLCRALGKGRVDARTAAELIREADEMIEMGVSIRAMLERAAAEG